MIFNKVVLKLKNGSVMKGSTADFLPNKTSFHLTHENGEVKEIYIETLKAIFFVKVFEGNKTYTEQYKDMIPGGGRKIQVKFTDGEVVVGYSQGYTPNRPGFFLVPADRSCNNERIYVVKSSTVSVEFI